MRRFVLLVSLALAAVFLLACSSGDDTAGGLIAPGTPGGAASSPSATKAPGSPTAVAPTVVTTPAVAATCTPADSRMGRIVRTGQRSFAGPPVAVMDATKKHTAVVKTSKGDITIDLATAEAPNTVNNFIWLACSGFYDGLNFHRVEKGFVIQGGDPAGNGSGGPGYTIDREVSDKINHNAAGVVSMARRPDNVNSTGSQFFITLSPQPGLDRDGYNAFGHVTAGMDVVNQIAIGDKILSVSVTEQ